MTTSRRRSCTSSSCRYNIPSRYPLFSCHSISAISSPPPNEPEGSQTNSTRRTELVTCTDKPRLHVAANGSLTLCAQRLQGLFHSLSKVLFIFRSHYLLAIGLGAIFSLRRSTPALCTALSNCATLGVLGELDHGRTDTNGTFALLGHTFRCD